MNQIKNITAFGNSYLIYSLLSLMLWAREIFFIATTYNIIKVSVQKTLSFFFEILVLESPVF